MDFVAGSTVGSMPAMVLTISPVSRGADGHRVEMQSGNTFRFQLDGSRIEHFTHGQVNPFGMTFDRNGDLFTADCHTKPINLLLQGGHHDSFGKPHDGLGYIPNVLEHLHNSTGIGGIAFGRGSSFPGAYQECTFGGNVVTARINRNRLEYDGSSMRAVEQPDFLICEDPWFRPVDLVFGPDGALYIADFYNRIIGHYEVPLDHPGRDRFRGRIWRVVYRGEATAVPTSISDLTRLSRDELIAKLDTENISLASAIVDQLTDGINVPEVPRVANRLRAVLYDSASAIHRAHALRSLGRLNVLDRNDVMIGIRAEHPLVRTQAYRLLASPKMSAHSDLVINGFADRDPMVQRAAVQAAAVHCREEFLEPLAALSATTPASDRFLKHAIRIALRNHFREESWFDQYVHRALPRDLDLVTSVCLAHKNTSSCGFRCRTYRSLGRASDFRIGQLCEIRRRICGGNRANACCEGGSRSIRSRSRRSVVAVVGDS